MQINQDSVVTMSDFQNMTYIPREQRKTILMLSDDVRSPSGIANQSLEIILNTAHHFNWIQIAATVKHPEEGQYLDLSVDIAKKTGVADADVKLIPSSGYGNVFRLRDILSNLQIDAIFIFTDPRFFIWLFQVEGEIRSKVPILYYNIWDNLPYPMYNRDFYLSCDALFSISKQTKNINKVVLGDGEWFDLDVDQDAIPGKTAISYIPHGIDSNTYFPIRENTHPELYANMQNIKKNMFGDDVPEFIFFYNNRNIRRKMPSNLMEAFSFFVEMLPVEEKNKVALLMHTDPVDENGTDLPVVHNTLMKDCRILFSANKIGKEDLNILYNIVDVTVNIANAEGFGLGTAESLMSGTPILSNVTGGLQDQMGFLDENGELVKFTKDWPSNQDGRYTQCGEWAFPVFSDVITLTGSPVTPYIYDSMVNNRLVAEKMFEIYKLSKSELEERGNKGREWLLSEECNMNAEALGKKMIKDIDIVLNNWNPIKRFNIHKLI